MVERGVPPEAHPSGESILDQTFVEQLLDTARDNLKLEGHLPTALLLHFDSGRRVVTSPALPDTSDEKAAYFTTLGQSIRQAGQRIREALLVVESWYVDAREEPDAFVVRPSYHPNRREVIAITGRNAQGTRHTFVVQPFTRGPDNEPVFEPLSEELAQYNVEAESGTYATGLLDDLFSAQRPRRKRRHGHGRKRRPRRRR